MRFYQPIFLVWFKNISKPNQFKQYIRLLKNDNFDLTLKSLTHLTLMKRGFSNKKGEKDKDREGDIYIPSFARSIPIPVPTL